MINSQKTGPSRATEGPEETILVGPHHNLIPSAPRSKRRGRRGEGDMGKSDPLSIRIGNRGNVVSSPSGAEPRAKMDIMHIRGQKEAMHLEHLFSIIKQWRGPQMSWGPGISVRHGVRAPKFRGKYFSGKCHEKLGHFINFVNFFHTLAMFSGKNVCPPKVD